MTERNIIINDNLEGDLVIPSGAQAIILFAHGSGSSRYSTRNQYVAQVLNDAGFATLLVDLLTPKEKEIDEKSRHLRFDIDLLAGRLLAVTQWLLQEPETSNLKIGYFGSSTGAAAALIAAAKLADTVKTIVCRGGRPDLADSRGVLQHVAAPTLLILGGNDTPVISLNRAALKQLSHAEAKELAIIPETGHLFEEPGKMEEVANITAEWFGCYLLRNGKKFENKYNQKASGLFSMFKEKSHIQMRFKDRAAAGDMLASLLNKYKHSDGITVIGIPRGGAVVAAAVARKLAGGFDIVIPRKLKAPDNSENAVGAMMQDGSVYLDSNLVESMKISNEYIEMEKSEQKKEIDRRMALYRPQPKEYNIKGRTVILVDDGAATGATIIAAARWIRKQEPKRLIIALPIASKQTAKLLNNEADSVEVLRSPSDFKAVEQFYHNFDEITDNQIIQIMKMQSLSY
jgi:predicted phosphoribosyltransferase/dienelactone hydrolase